MTQPPATVCSFNISSFVKTSNISMALINVVKMAEGSLFNSPVTCSIKQTEKEKKFILLDYEKAEK